MTGAFITGTLAGWCACLVWRWAEDHWASERAARDLRAWNAAEAKARVRQRVKQRTKDYHVRNGGTPAA